MMLFVLGHQIQVKPTKKKNRQIIVPAPLPKLTHKTVTKSSFRIHDNVTGQTGSTEKVREPEKKIIKNGIDSYPRYQIAGNLGRTH